MFFGQKIQPALCSLQKSFAENAAGAQCNFGLQNQIPLAQRIPLGI